MATVKLLPQATKRHLYDLITDGNYRSNASHSTYDIGGPGSPGKPVTKYGWNSNLPSGKNAGPPDPGKYRLATFLRTGVGGNTFWYKMEHVGDNSYKFEAITGFPPCPKCKGTGDHVCPDCNGSGRIVDGNFSSPCVKCKKPDAMKSGVVVCECGGKKLANGISVDPDFANW
jgi:hypothetical protein